MSNAALDALIDGVLLPPPSKGRRARTDVSCVFVRPLNEADVKALWDIKPGELDTVKSLTKLRHRHHYIARLIAEGRENVEISAIVGMEPAYVSQLRVDPAMVELVAHYKTQVDATYLNVHERLAALGLHTVEELHDRLETNPEKFTVRELMELAALGLDRSGHGPQTKQTVQHQHSIDPTTLSKIKDELSKRQRGQILTLTQESGRAASGPIIEHEPVAGAASAAARGEGEGS